MSDPMNDEYYTEAELQWFRELAIPIRIDREDFEGVMVGAMEGGSNEWLTAVDFETPRPKDVPSSIWAVKELLAGREIELCDDQNDSEDPWRTLSAEKLAEGIRMWASWQTKNDRLFVGDSHIDWGQHDAADADAALQYALFGEVVYS